MRTGAAYIRVSTEEQLEFSPDSQLKKLLEYAGQHDISLPEAFIFSDEGISGRSAEKRPGFLRMIAAARQKPRPFDVILVWKFSRFARSRQDSIFYKSLLRRECGIDVVSITEQLTDDPTAILVEALLEAMDEYYSLNLAQEVRRGMGEKFSRGGVISAPPYGYRIQDGRFVPDAPRDAVVRAVFDLYTRGAACRAIAAELNRQGLRTARGNLFEGRTIEYMLSNPAYIGYLRRGASGHDRFYRGPDTETVFAGHEPLVSREIFDRAQERLAAQRRAPPERAHSGQDHMLRGLVRCSACGATLTRTAGGTALQCCRYARGQCMESHFVSLRELEGAICAQVYRDLGDQPLHYCPRTEMADADTIHTLIEAQRQRLQRARDAYTAGVDSLEDYAHIKEEAETELRRLEALLQSVPPAAETRTLSVRALLDTSPPALQNALLRAVIRKIVFDRAKAAFQIVYYT